MSTVQIVLVLLCAAAGATVQGSVGIGFGLVAAPGLVAIDPAFAPGPVLLVSQVVGLRHLLAEWRDIDRDALRHGLFGVPIGMAMGIALLSAVDQRTMALLVGGATVIGTLILLTGFQITRSVRTDIGASVLSAFGATAAGLPGPPLVAVYSEMKPACMRATCSGVIATISILAFFLLSLSGNFGGEEAELLAWLVPGALLGLVAARFVRPYVERPGFRQLVLVLALLGGAALIVRTLI